MTAAPALPSSGLHDRVLALLPGHALDLARLRALATAPPVPVVAVVGKYNQGKSRLLNELCGTDGFTVADRRETLHVSHHDARGMRWMDAPGLDADVAGEDDRQAAHATWIAADIRLLVHSAREGELDGAELHLLQDLLADDAATGRHTLLVLTQIDQVADAATLQGIQHRIAGQAATVPLYAVSPVRHRKGCDGDKPMMVSASGVPALMQALHALGTGVAKARTIEASLRMQALVDALGAVIAVRARALAACTEQLAQSRAAFLHGLQALFTQAAEEIEALDADEAALALQPDTHAQRYVMTDAKRARTKQQLVYSRINLRLSAHLTGHAVQLHLPDPGAMPAGLNTVMVTVLGVAVKYRDELRRMFCETAGAQRLQRAFTGYYDGSGARLQAVADAASCRDAVHDAKQTLALLERVGAGGLSA